MASIAVRWITKGSSSLNCGKVSTVIATDILAVNGAEVKNPEDVVVNSGDVLYICGQPDAIAVVLPPDGTQRGKCPLLDGGPNIDVAKRRKCK